MKKIRQWISINSAKRPSLVVLLLILLASLVLFVVATVVIINCVSVEAGEISFWNRVLYIVTLVKDSGSLSYVIEQLDNVNILIVLMCLFTDFVSLIVFNSAIIGYVSNLISVYIEDADSDSKGLYLEDHVAILNWNDRASEIINDFMLSGKSINIVVLQSGDKTQVKNEIEETLADTLKRENGKIEDHAEKMGFWAGRNYLRKNLMHNRLSIIVRNGDPYSVKQLGDICLAKASSIILLNSHDNEVEDDDNDNESNEGNINIIKTLIQVTQIISEQKSSRKQKIIVEIEDEWTNALVSRIIKRRCLNENCQVVTFEVNNILGYILFQICIMPELNLVYSDLFSNDIGSEFYSLTSSELPAQHINTANDMEFVKSYLDNHSSAIPLSIMKDKNDIEHFYFMAANKGAITKSLTPKYDAGFQVAINPNFKFKERNIIILGQNSRCHAIMAGFDSFRAEWQLEDPKEILNITVIDIAENLKKMDNYKKYSYVKKVIPVDIYDRETFYKTINPLLKKNDADISILILSDDEVAYSDLDTNALTYLIYIQDIITNLQAANPAYDSKRVNIIVEILDPKNRDVVNSYNVDTVVISNHFISKMIGQLSENEALYDFYLDILTYDDDEEVNSYELYIKPVKDFFTELPKPCQAGDLVKQVYYVTAPENPTVILGYFNGNKQLILFEGNLGEIKVSLSAEDKLVLFASH